MKKIGLLIMFLLIFFACSNERTIDLSSNSLDEITQGNLSPLINITQNESLELEDLTSKEEFNESKEDLDQEENNKPTLELKNNIVLNYTEGDKIQLNPKVSDPDGDEIEILYYEPFDSDGIWDTELGDAGTHRVVFTITDGKHYENISVDVFVEKKNRAPIIKEIDDIVVNEGEEVIIEFEVEDEENDNLTITYKGFMTKDSYKTNFFDSGVYNQTVIVEDGFNVVETSFKIIIKDVNQPPKFVGVSKYNLKENETIDLDLKFEDLDKDEVEFKLPDQIKDGKFYATIGDIGTKKYEMEFTDGENRVKQELIFIVEDVNFPPTLIKINSKAYSENLVLNFKEGENATLEIIHEDLDGDKITISYDGFFKSNSKYIDFDSEGEHKQKITLSDGIVSKTFEFKIFIEDVNRGPLFLGFD